MQVVIVAKTRAGSGACIGGITLEGRSVRLVAANAQTNPFAGMEYEVGERWEVEAWEPEEIVPPHVENVIVAAKRRLSRWDDPIPLIERHMPPTVGGVELLYDGLTRATSLGALYIAERVGVPPYSTTFWRPDQSLHRVEDAKRIRYRYPSPDGGHTLTFVGFQEPLELIPAGPLLRVSLAHWWRPREMPEGELRCYVQLSGWFLSKPSAYPAATPETSSPSPPVAAPRPATLAEARQLLKSVFGYDSFWPLQEQVISNVLAQRDTLAIMPTGSGKSLCYQLPALLREGLTVVVSPLIALMQDQVEQLRELGVPAAFLNSSLDYQSYLATATRVREGEVRLLYVAPETLLRPETLLMLEQCRVACLTIDEAHCISSWGHDFRPDYRRLLPLRERLPGAVCIALTATATPRVQGDIQAMLGLSDADTFIASFDRPNLHLAVQQRVDGLTQTLAFLDEHREQSGIIYCSTRKQVDLLARQLEAKGYAALPYHAGLDDESRRTNQRRFVRDDVPIMVATIAFGMGINKSNVRFILHFNLPKNIENYYQQIGRAGRDGLRADCLLLFSQSDVWMARHFIDEGPEPERPGKQARLQAMVRYAEADCCRRGPLLTYFGEAAPTTPCELCDNCLDEGEESETVDVTLAAQKFLSCVKRTGERFGVAHTIQVLRGSRAKKVLQWGHDRLSTYGIGVEHSTKTWKRLAQQFIMQGLVEQDMQHGSLRLTPSAYAVFRGEREVFAVLETPTHHSTGGLHTEHDEELFMVLRHLRKQLADEADVPAYVIFSDRTLSEMATYFPQSTSALLGIHGVGAVKLATYGDAFLSCIRAYCQEHNIAERPKPAVDMMTASGEKRRFVEVGELFAAGHSIAQLQTLYGVKQSTIISHLYHYRTTGHEVDGTQVLAASTLPTETQQAVLATIAELGPAQLRPIYEAHDEAIPFDDLHVLRLYSLCQ